MDITDKAGNLYNMKTITHIPSSLVIAYATDFWAGAWQELLAKRDPKGDVSEQWGTYDASGNIYPSTLSLAKEVGVDITQHDWQRTLWDMACTSNLRDIEPYWSFDAARDELTQFICPTVQGGYGGSIILLKDRAENIVGFAAYTVAIRTMMSLAERRFPYGGLTDMLMQRWPDIKRMGIYLDFAISEKLRGRGLGSKLFDARLEAMLQDGAQAIMGRTIKTSPAQFYGNYQGRGMQVIYTDPNNPDKCILGMHKKEVKPR